MPEEVENKAEEAEQTPEAVELEALRAENEELIDTLDCRKTAIRDQKPGNSTAANTMNAAVSRATHWSWGQ